MPSSRKAPVYFASKARPAQRPAASQAVRRPSRSASARKHSAQVQAATRGASGSATTLSTLKRPVVASSSTAPPGSEGTKRRARRATPARVTAAKSQGTSRISTGGRRPLLARAARAPRPGARGGRNTTVQDVARRRRSTPPAGTSSKSEATSRRNSWRTTRTRSHDQLRAHSGSPGSAAKMLQRAATDAASGVACAASAVPAAPLLHCGCRSRTRNAINSALDPYGLPEGDHFCVLDRDHLFLGDTVKPVIAALAFLGAIACATSGSGVDPRLEYTYNSSVNGVIVVPDATAGSTVCNNLAVVATVGDQQVGRTSLAPEQEPLLLPDRQPALRQGGDGEGAARRGPQVCGRVADGLRLGRSGPAQARALAGQAPGLPRPVRRDPELVAEGVQDGAWRCHAPSARDRWARV